MKYRAFLYGLLVALMLVVTACSGQPQQTPSPQVDQPSQAAAEEEVPAGEPAGEVNTELSGKIVWAYPGEEVDLRMRPEIVKMFNEKYPNITVEEQPVPPDGYDTQILASISAGTPPDVFISGDVFVAPYIENQVAEDLTPYLENDPDLSEDMFFASVLDYFRGPNGHVYMLPDAIDVQRIYYNKDLFAAAGVPEPTEGWTIEDFENAAAALTSGEGPEKVYGFYADSWWATWMPYVWGNGGDMISADGTRCTLTEEPAVEALEWYAGLMRQGYSPSPEEMTGMGMGGWDLFVTGRAAMYQSGGWDIPSFEEEADFEWSMVALPVDEQPATVLHLTTYVMAANSQNKEAAWEFMKFLASEEVYTMEASKYGWGIPPRVDVAEKVSNNPPEGTSEMNLLNVKIGNATTEFGRLPTKILNWNEFRFDGFEIGLEGFWNGVTPVEEAVNQACSIQPVPFE